MARIQEHEFVDLSKPTTKKHDENTRRSFLTKVSGIAAITAMAPQAFARNFIDKYDADRLHAIRILTSSFTTSDSSTSSVTHRFCVCTVARCGPKDLRGTALADI